ncbi:hypothetical protein Ocin01_14475 [Orchesella cincta]|uniref:Uncharacterized protein n=1 Tax=Orchesella cincta TaxID=48709 RepID=A0A1D2MH64_ORCCI|nr:hypothetical protein Ocin01_14475 [Orchesella cincta]
MNKLTFALLGLILVSAYAVPADKDNEQVSDSERKIYEETVTVDDTTEQVNAITPLKSIFLPNMARIVCWRCRNPCSWAWCCNDGYPQCCKVNGRCRCCRR